MYILKCSFYFYKNHNLEFNINPVSRHVNFKIMEIFVNERKLKLLIDCYK